MGAGLSGEVLVVRHTSGARTLRPAAMMNRVDPTHGSSDQKSTELGTAAVPVRVLLLADSCPTMQVWSSEIAALAAAVRELGLGEVSQSSIELEEGRQPEITPHPGLILVVSDGGSSAWRSESTVRWLLSLARQGPTVVLHLLSRSRWNLTRIDPDPIRIRVPVHGIPNAGWEWNEALPLASTSGSAGLVPVPVLSSDHSGLKILRQILSGSGDWISATSLLLPESGRVEVSSRPDATPDAKIVVDGFRAEAPPDAFHLATYLAAVPLDVAVMQEIRTRLLANSTTEILAVVLVSSLVQTVSPPAGRSLHVSLEFRPGVREELLISAGRADIESVVGVLKEFGEGRPGVFAFTELFDNPSNLEPLSEFVDDAKSRADEVAWRRARARVLIALGGSCRRQGLAERASLPSGISEMMTGSPQRRDRADTVRRIMEGSPVPSRDQELEIPATVAPSVSDMSSILAVPGDYPLRNPNFTGRGELLEELHASLRSKGSTAVLPHALHGMGGVGKTMLAIEYIYRHQDEYDVIWWIPAQRATGIQSSLMELGQRLALNLPNEANVAVPAVLAALRRGKPYGRWLLVFDNAESPEQVIPYLPKGGPGHILITSRDARWSQLARPLEIDVFTRDESKELLQRRGPDITDEEADRLAEALGDLPLAIEQAAAWHYETGMPAEEYLRLLREKQVELLDQPAPLDYRVPVIAAWNVSLDQLEMRNPEALQLLQLCAFFATEPIPRGLFTAARIQAVAFGLDAALRDPIRFARALREISRYSLARIDHRANSIQMHRLVQAALIARMSNDLRRRLRHAAHRVLAVNDPNDPENPAEFATYGNLYPHVLASNSVSCDDPWVRGIVINEARYLYRWGDQGAAVELARAAHTAWSAAYGDDDAQTLEIARWWGFFLFAVGRYGEAAEINAASLAVFRRLEQGGRPDPDGELKALWNVAIDRRVQGEFAEALAIAERAYERSMRAYGEDDPDALMSAHDLAVSLRLSGLFSQARDRDQDTYDRRSRVFGADHPQSVLTRLGLLIDHRELGDYRAVERPHEHELNRARVTLGELNPTTLFARRLMAVAQRKAGHHQAAHQTSERAGAEFRSRYGEQHPDTLAAESNFAIDLRQVGQLEAAQDLGADVVRRYTEILGPEHPHTLTAQVNLAITYRLLGEVERALHIDSEAHEVLVRRLGADHPSSLVAAANLGSDLFAVGDVRAALDSDLDSWGRLGLALGEEHPTTLACESNLSIDLRVLDRHEDAEQHYQHALRGLRAVLGEGHPGVRQAETRDARANCDIDPMPL
jgi:tetratricopeptide (TPR) repeat protein